VFQKKCTKFNALYNCDDSVVQLGALNTVTRLHQNVKKLFDNTTKGKVCIKSVKYSLFRSWQVNYSRNTNTDNIFNAIHGRNSLQQVQITGLTEMMFKVSTLQMNDQQQINHWSIAPLISSWLIMFKQLFRLVSDGPYVWISDNTPAAEEHPKLNNPRTQNRWDRWPVWRKYLFAGWLTCISTSAMITVLLMHNYIQLFN